MFTVFVPHLKFEVNKEEINIGLSILCVCIQSSIHHKMVVKPCWVSLLHTVSFVQNNQNKSPISNMWWQYRGCCNDFKLCHCHFNINTFGPRQNGRHFADDTLKCIFLNKNVRLLIKISLKFVPKGPINNIPALVQVMAWHWPGDKPLSEPMMASLLMNIYICNSASMS